MQRIAKPTAFAVLDILGYGSMMSKKPDDVFAIIIELLESSKRNWIVQHDLDRFVRFSGIKSVPIINYLFFSDTLIIYFVNDTASNDLLFEPANMINTICYATSLTLAYFMSSGVPLRGAISFGDTFISHDPIFFTGKELYKAFKLERKQNWAGVAIDSHITENVDYIKDNNFIIEYPIPLKENFKEKINYAVDWVSCLGNIPENEPQWNRVFSNDDPEILLKGEETLKFYKHVTSKSLSVNTFIPHELIDVYRKKLSLINH